MTDYIMGTEDFCVDCKSRYAVADECGISYECSEEAKDCETLMDAILNSLPEREDAGCSYPCGEEPAGCCGCQTWEPDPMFDSWFDQYDDDPNPYFGTYSEE